MGKVMFENSISLDGFVAGPNDGVDNPLGDGGETLFKWYQTGDTTLHLRGTDMVFSVSAASAAFLQPEWDAAGAGIVGRRMFDIAKAWGGKPPSHGQCFVLTHHPPQEWVYTGSPFTFVTEGIQSAVAQAKQAAGDKKVSVGSASVAQQCIQAGLLDEIHLDIVPVLLGGGVRLFDRLGLAPIHLQVINIVQGQNVTHHTYRIIH